MSNELCIIAMTLVIFISLIMNSDETNLCKILQCALCLCIKSQNILTVKWKNVRIN